MSAMLLVKASLLLSVALLAARLLRRAPAATRHGLWSVLFAAMLALPLLAATLPAVNVPVPAGWTTAPLAPVASVPIANPERAATIDTGAPAPSVLPSPAPPDRPLSTSFGVPPEAPALLMTLWLFGTAVAAGVLLLSLIRVRCLARSAEEVNDPAWHRAAAAIGARLGLRHPPRLLMSPGVSTPMASRVWRACIFLPVSALTWSTEQRDVVLAHEIAHLAGHDPLRHLVTRLTLAVYWCHPLAWIAARQAAVAREQACDEAVIALGTRRSAYAQVLLDLAESLYPSPALAALPMVQRSLLENRVMAILNADSRPVPRRLVLIPTLGVALLTLALAAVQPAVFASGERAVAIERWPAASAATPPRAAGESTVPVEADSVITAQRSVGRDSACWSDLSSGSSFSGTTSTSDVGGRMVIREQVGSRGYDRVILKTLGDLQLCMVAEEVGDRDGRPSEWIGRSRRTVLEARRGPVVQRMEFGRQSGAGVPITWQVGGAQRPVDEAAQQWRDRMLATLDTTWELSSLRGEVSSLHGQISSIHGERSSLQGEISSLRGEVSSMRGRASSIRGEESSLRGEISSIRGQVSSLRGAISSEQGAISSLNASRYGSTDADRTYIESRTARHRAEITRIERELRDFGEDAKVTAVERRIAALGADGKVAAIEKEIRAFDLEEKVAAVERRIAALDVEGKVGAIERQITALDADRRTRQLEQRRDEELKRLEAAFGAIK